LLEEEAGWLARREELHRDRAAAVAVRRARRARAEWLRAQLDQLRSVGDDQLRALRADINTVTLSIQQVFIIRINLIIYYYYKRYTKDNNNLDFSKSKSTFFKKIIYLVTELLFLC